MQWLSLTETSAPPFGFVKKERLRRGSLQNDDRNSIDSLQTCAMNFEYSNSHDNFQGSVENHVLNGLNHSSELIIFVDVHSVSLFHPLISFIFNVPSITELSRPIYHNLLSKTETPLTSTV